MQLRFAASTFLRAVSEPSLKMLASAWANWFRTSSRCPSSDGQSDSTWGHPQSEVILSSLTPLIFERFFAYFNFVVVPKQSPPNVCYYNHRRFSRVVSRRSQGNRKA